MYYCSRQDLENTWHKMARQFCILQKSLIPLPTLYQNFSKLRIVYTGDLVVYSFFYRFPYQRDNTGHTLCSRRFIDTFASQFAVIRIPIISPTRNKSNKLHVHRDAPMIISAGSANGPPQSDIGFRALSLPYCWRTV